MAADDLELERVADALRMLAEADANRGAPEQVEAVVMAAWHAGQARGLKSASTAASWGRGSGAVSVSSGGAQVVAFAAGGRRPLSDVARHWIVAGAAAAAALVAIAVGMQSASRTVVVPAETSHRAALVERPAGPHRTATQARRVREAAVDAAHARRVAVSGGASLSSANEAVDVQTVRGGTVGATADIAEGNVADRIASSAGSGSANSSANSAASSAVSSEADGMVFTPFPYAEPLRPTEVRQVVRVAVPRDTVMQAGLAMQVSDRASDRVLADVLVGEDGVARGIRLVRQVKW